MNLDFQKALKAPMCVDKWLLKVIIGGILLCIPFVNFIVLGYMIKALKNFINKDDRLPEYNDWGGMFITGLKLLVGCLLFALPFVVIIALLTMLLSKAGMVLSVLVIIVEIIAGIAGMIMIAGFALDEKILSMLNFKRMMQFVEDNRSGLVSFILVSLGVYLVYVLVSFVACLLVITMILLPFISYAMMISVYNVVGQFAANAPKIDEIKAEANA